MNILRNQNTYTVRESQEPAQVYRDLPRLISDLFREAQKRGIDMTSLRVSVELSTREPSEVPG